MFALLHPLKTLWQLITRPTPAQKEVLGEGRPFYLVLTFILTTLTILIAYNMPRELGSARLLGFIVVMALHIGLHWLNGFTLVNPRAVAAYLLAQALLGIAAVALAAAPAVSLAVFASLIGETIGTQGTTRPAWAAVAGYLALTFAGYLIAGGQAALDEWLSPTTSTMVLLIVFMVLFRRQLDAGQQAQALAAELAAANRQLAAYANQVEELTLAAERQRLARELHDTLAQGVAGLILQLEAADAFLEQERTDRVQTIIRQSTQRARTTLAEARAAIDDLRRQHTSLGETIERHSQRFSEATGIPCELTIELNPATAVPVIIADHVDRIISESLSNITRHAQARHVWLGVRQSTGRLTIDVRDDGIGFDVATATRAGHYGLLGLRERARLMNGAFNIASQPGAGTHLTITLPLEAA